jgi:hypothetical protein
MSQVHPKLNRAVLISEAEFAGGKLSHFWESVCQYVNAHTAFPITQYNAVIECERLRYSIP